MATKMRLFYPRSFVTLVDTLFIDAGVRFFRCRVSSSLCWKYRANLMPENYLIDLEMLAAAHLMAFDIVELGTHDVIVFTNKNRK